MRFDIPTSARLERRAPDWNQAGAQSWSIIQDDGAFSAWHSQTENALKSADTRGPVVAMPKRIPTYRHPWRSNQEANITASVWLPYLAILLTFELAGDVAAKEFALHGHVWRMALAAALVLCGNISWQLMLRGGMELSRGGIIFAVGVAVGVVAIGVIGYGEPISPRTALGLAFGLVSIGLLAA